MRSIRPKILNKKAKKYGLLMRPKDALNRRYICLRKYYGTLLTDELKWVSLLAAIF